MRFALICITTKDLMVRRYVRNPHGKVWETHVSQIVEFTDETLAALEEFRQQPTKFELQSATEAA